VKSLGCVVNPLSDEYKGKSLETIYIINQEKRAVAFRRKRAAKVIQRAWWCYYLAPRFNQEGEWEAPCAKISFTRDVIPLL
jgi:hypothetical protein